jgi:hypothetical protein
VRWLIIAAPIVVAKTFGVDGYFSRPTFIAVGLILLFLVILTATLGAARWGRKHP